jgi:hypothetical protein
VVLKNPSEYFKKDITSIDSSVQKLAKDPELNTFSDAFESFKNNLSKIEVLSDFTETLDNYRISIERVNHLSSSIDDIKNEIDSLVKIEDLDRAMMSQLIVVEQSIRDVQSKVKGINEKNLIEIRLDVSNLTKSISEFLEVDVPKYKKLIVDSELRTSTRYENLEENVNQSLGGIGKFVEEKYQELTENLQDINQKSFDKINSIENDKQELINEVTEKINDVKNLSKKVSEELRSNQIYKEHIEEKVTDLQVNIIRNDSHIRVQNKNLQAIQDEVKEALSKINLEEFEQKSHKLGKKIKYLEEVFEKFSEREILTENIIVEPSSTSNKDPLTPLDKNFVTLEQLQEHYRLFINRIQQQLATLGGGGETQLKYLDDIVGIATNPSVYDGKFLTYDHSIKKFEFVTVTQGGGGNVAIAITNVAPTGDNLGDIIWYDNDIGRSFLYYTDEDGSQWVDMSPAGTTATQTYWTQTNAGIHTLSNVGIGTTNPISKLDIRGDLSNYSLLNLSSPSSVDPTNYGILGIGRTLGFLDTNIIAHFSADVDDHAQVIIQNHSTGPSASSDFIVNNNLEEGNNAYGNFGINGSNFAEFSSDPFSEPSGVYLYALGKSLTIGTQDTGPIKFAVNFSEIVRVVDGGVGIGTTNPTTILDVQDGDIRVGKNNSNGVILTSPNGTKYRLIVDNAGALSTVLVP